MARSNEFTHGGGIGKNIRPMLRALLNTLFFGAFWFRAGSARSRKGALSGCRSSFRHSARRRAEPAR